MEKKSFECGGKKAAVYCAVQADAPLIVLNSFTEDGTAVIRSLQELSAPECNLLIISNLNWDRDLSPWYCPPLIENDASFAGGADEYLDLLLAQILPKAKAMLVGTPCFTGIAGYSLAGLFALYAIYHCGAFERAASMSGSLWFPGFREYVQSHEPLKHPDKLYFSLGDREAKTRNPYLKNVQQDTEQIVSCFQRKGLNVAWELNPGNHFKDADFRSAKGIKALLE